MLACWESHFLFLVPASIPVGSGNMAIRQAKQRIKEHVSLHFQGYMVPCSERTSGLQTFWRKNMQRDKWPQNNFPVGLPKNTSLKNIFNRHSQTIFKTLFPKYCNTLTTSGHFLRKNNCKGKNDSSDSIQNMYLQQGSKD